MALTALPVSESFALVWEHDPALVRSDSFDHDYKVAVETLNWSVITAPGEKPTFFHFRLLDADTLFQLMEGGYGPLRQTVLAFRLALARVENFDQAPQLRRAPDPKHPQFPLLVDTEFMDYLNRVSLGAGRQAGEVALRLGDLVLKRSMGVDPK